MSTKVVTVLMKRLIEIDAICNPDRQFELDQQNATKVDKFTQKKRDLAACIREIREDLSNRDKARNSDSPADFAKRGYEIREKIKRAEELGDELEQINKKKNNKLVKPGSDTGELKRKQEQRKQIIDLMHQHIKQVKLEQSKTGKEVDDDVSSIDGGEFTDGDVQLMQMNLKDLSDPEFETIRSNEVKIDAGIERVHAGVTRLKNIALQVGEILEEQDGEIDRITELAGETNEELKSANRLLGKVIKDVKSPAMFCCDCILCLMVIGIAVGMYFALTN